MEEIGIDVREEVALKDVTTKVFEILFQLVNS